MDLEDFVSFGLDTKLKCFVCQNYLSFFPVSLCCNNQSVCGRCDIPEATIAFRNEAFEDLAKLIKFPCRYQSEGCLEALVPQDIPKHEENCAFREVSCIISKPIQCEWKGSLKILRQHCHEKHSDVILKDNELMMNSSVSSEYNSLLERNDLLYIFSTKYCAESKTLYCAMYNSKYETAAKRVSAHNRITLKSANKELSLYLEMTSFEDFVYTDVCLHSLINENEEENLILCEVALPAVEEEEYRFDEEMNSALLSMLKCQICFQYASTLPIYRFYDYTTQQTVCSSCRGRVRNAVQDVNLEKIASFVKYPCKYKESGCTFISVGSRKYQHEAVCQYQTKDCALLEKSCTWKGLAKDLSHHVTNEHQDVIFSSVGVLELSQNDTAKKCLLLKLCGRLFRVVYCYCRPHFLWVVQSINSCEENFNYQIEIVGDIGTDRKLLMKKNYLNMAESEDIFKDLRDCCFVHEDQVFEKPKNGTIEVKSVKFRVRVLK